MSDAALVWGLSGALFVTGFAAVVLRRQLLAMLLGLELMTNAANVALAYYARVYASPAALAAVFLLLAVAACEAVVGLSLILALNRLEGAWETDAMKELKG